MKSTVIIWVIIIILLAISLFSSRLPIWIPVAVWIISVLVRVNAKIGDHSDSENKSIRDQELQLKQKAEEMAGRGLAYSGFRNQEEQKIKEDFEFERRKAKRKPWVDLIDTLLLK